MSQTNTKEINEQEETNGKHPMEKLENIASRKGVYQTNQHFIDEEGIFSGYGRRVDNEGYNSTQISKMVEDKIITATLKRYRKGGDWYVKIRVWDTEKEEATEKKIPISEIEG